MAIFMDFFTRISLFVFKASQQCFKKFHLKMYNEKPEIDYVGVEQLIRNNQVDGNKVVYYKALREVIIYRMSFDYYR